MGQGQLRGSGLPVSPPGVGVLEKELNTQNPGSWWTGRLSGPEVSIRGVWGGVSVSHHPECPPGQTSRWHNLAEEKRSGHQGL